MELKDPPKGVRAIDGAVRTLALVRALELFMKDEGPISIESSIKLAGTARAVVHTARSLGWLDGADEDYAREFAKALGYA